MPSRKSAIGSGSEITTPCYTIVHVAGRCHQDQKSHAPRDLIGRDQQQSSLNSCMKISEITTPADQQKVNSLDRAAKQAAYAAKQERFRQRQNRYSDRMRKLKPGAKPPKRPEPPKPPQLSE